jgi:hypothetical protein
MTGAGHPILTVELSDSDLDPWGPAHCHAKADQVKD